MLSLAAMLTAAGGASAEATFRPRLPAATLAVIAPSENVRGSIGRLSAPPAVCASIPSAQMRRRIVDVAVQEWGFFGFPIADLTRFGGEADYNEIDPESLAAGSYALTVDFLRRGGRFPALPAEETLRLTNSVIGYWASTPQAGLMIDRQNEAWASANDVDGRWRDPWSAAFVSWVMCESGLGEPVQFQRAIAHWTYVDQAIRARDGLEPKAAFTAYDLGEQAIAPGDLLCSSRRPVYRSLAERRRQIGAGARSHCDIVVKVETTGKRIFTIGGNVRRAVTLKLFPAEIAAGGHLRPVDLPDDGVSEDARPLFAHLKLRANPIDANALDSSPTMKALDCVLIYEDRHPAYGHLPPNAPKGAC